MKTPIELCTDFERLLKPMGWHIALTGSALYGDAAGGGSAKDIDVIIYPHILNGKPVSDASPLDIANRLGILEFECTADEEYDNSDDYIWIGYLPDERRIDCFFLTP